MEKNKVKKWDIFCECVCMCVCLRSSDFKIDSDTCIRFWRESNKREKHTHVTY